jgi:hypothetical protein
MLWNFLSGKENLKSLGHEWNMALSSRPHLPKFGSNFYQKISTMQTLNPTIDFIIPFLVTLIAPDFCIEGSK